MSTITDYKCVTDVKGILAYMEDADKVAFDYETTPDEGFRDDDKAALDPAKSHICTISLSVKEGSGIMVPVAHKIGKNIDPIEFGAWLKDFLTNPNITKIAHNLAFESMFSYARGDRDPGAGI